MEKLKEKLSGIVPALAIFLLMVGLVLRCGWEGITGLRLGVIHDLGRTNHRLVSRVADPGSYWTAEVFYLVLAAIGLVGFVVLTVALIQSRRNDREETTEAAPRSRHRKPHRRP